MKTKTIQFRGGCITGKEVSGIPNGGFSMIQNKRALHPGFEKRAGCRVLNTTADSTNEVLTLFQFSKGRVSEKHTYAQMGDGDVLEGYANPPIIPELMTLDVAPATTWADGAAITGQTSAKTCVIVKNLSPTTYVVKDRSGTFTLGEILSDGSVTADQGAANPTFGNIAFGAEVFSGSSGQVPASWAVNNDIMAYANGVDQHQLYPGTDPYVKKFIVFKSAAAIPTIPDLGEDYTEQVTDTLTTTVAVLDSLSLLTDYDAVFVMTDIPATSLKFTVSAANGNVANSQLHYWNGAWTAPSGFSDGTSTPTSATTFSDAFSATTEWTATDSTLSSVAGGQAGNCLQIAESGGTNPGEAYHDVTTVIGQVYRLIYYFKKGTADNGKVTIGTTADPTSLSAGTNHSDADWTKYEIEFTPAATTTRITLISNDATAGETSLFDTLAVVTGKTFAQTGSMSWTAPTDEIPHYMYDACGYWYRVSLTYGVLDAEVELSSVQYNTTWKSLQNVWDGIPIPAAEVQVYDQSATTYYTYASSEVTANSSTTSDIFYIASSDPLVGFYIDVGKYPNTTAATTINAVNYFNGAAFAAVSNLYDGTDGLSKSGWVTFSRQSTVQPRQFNDTGLFAYWYSFTVDQTLSSSVKFSVDVMPYFAINEFGSAGLCNCSWKDRMLYVFARYPNDIVVSAKHRPMVLNGDDYTILDRPGDGRANRVVCMKRIYNELLVWQEEKGVDGGCLTLYQGYSPSTFGKMVISTKYGTFSAKTAVVIDGIRMGINMVENPPVSVAFFLSHFGVFMCDGKTIECISDQEHSSIQNYFDPTSSVCIRDGYESKMWLAYDPARQCLRIGLVSGSSATLPNIFPVYDLQDRAWTFDVLAQEFACLANCEAGSGSVTAVQIAGGIDDGTIYQSNYGTNNDVSTAIDSYALMELDLGGSIFRIGNVVLRQKVQSAGNVTITPYENGIAGTAITAPMTEEVASQVSRRNFVPLNPVSDHISLKFQNATVSQSILLKDLSLEMEAVPQP